MDADKALTAPVNDIGYMHLAMEGHSQLAAAMADKIRDLFARLEMRMRHPIRLTDFSGTFRDCLGINLHPAS